MLKIIESINVYKYFKNDLITCLENDLPAFIN